MLDLTAEAYPLQPLPVSNDARHRLEAALASYLGYQEAIVLSSVDNAFSLALSTLPHGSGVLCSPNAPIALFKALHKHALKADYCDLRLDGTMETRFFDKSRSEHSKALVLSHNHGLLSDTKATSGFAGAHALTFIEDATQAFGKKEKSEAALVIFALDALLPAVIANGALLVTDDTALAASLRQQAQGGYLPKKFWNYDVTSTDDDLRLDPLTSQLALSALTEIGQRTETIQAVQRTYFERLASNRLIELPKSGELVAQTLFPVALVPALFCPKEDIYLALVEAGVPIKVGNKPIYKTTAFKDESLSLFGAEECFKAQLLLPSHHLMTQDDADFVVDTLEKILETYGYRGCSF